MRKPLVLAAAVFVGLAALARRRSSAKAADAALWREATNSPR